MKTELQYVDFIISKIKQGQDNLWPLIDAEIEENNELPRRLWVYFALSVFLRNPEKTQWKLLLENIESLIEDKSEGIQCEIVYQYILETFSNSISNNHFDPKWIVNDIGPLSREYIVAYDKFMGGKTPGF